MKAAVINSYGPPEVLKIQQVPRPTISKRQILVKIEATSVTSADSRIRGARFPRGFGFIARLAFGINKPRTKILGSTYSGVIHDLGDNVSNFKLGDEVCGMSGIKMGSYAEYIKVDGFKSIAIKPKNISHTDAAGILFGGTAALFFLRDKLKIQQNDEVLINGASGAVGCSAVQLARYYGAKVTAVTSSLNADLAKQLGAEQIIDFTKVNLDNLARKFDLVLDTVGNISPELAKKLLNKNGRAGLMVASLGEILKAHGPVKTGTATETKKDIEFLLDLMVQGELEAVINKIYKFDDIVKAHNYVDSGVKVGNVILRF
jgi:NADPH:quinone reductase-like Zn-dependent oxidoreductase